MRCWHWRSLNCRQETYWKGVLPHDLELNRAYAEFTRIAGELKQTRAGIGSRSFG
jgi:hypothetical protein